MAEIAAKVTEATGVKIELVGFDNGTGMPRSSDYRDHPDCYGEGDFPMQDYNQLRNRLPANSQLIIGNVAETVIPYLSGLRPDCPIGYVVIDVDYYSSSVECLKIFSGPADRYLPESLMYLDDITYPQHNPWQGEYLAINEFNSRNELRKACPYNFLRHFRLLKNAIWIDQVYLMHTLDHERKRTPHGGPSIVLDNPYLE
jgi:hypothetical protein